MKGFKGFSKGLICRDKQYAENTVFEESEAVVCEKGMHFCVNPFDVLDHYDLVNKDGSFNDFAEVEALAEAKTDDNKKFCTTKLKIGAKLSFGGFVKACVNFLFEKNFFAVEDCKKNDITSGNDSKLAASGNDSKLAASGNDSQLAASGNDSQLAASGNDSQLESTGENCVLAAIGRNSIAKAKKGSWITLAEWKWSDEKRRNIPVCVKTEFVDGERIKEDTFYKLVDGEFKEVD